MGGSPHLRLMDCRQGDCRSLLVQHDLRRRREPRRGGPEELTARRVDEGHSLSPLKGDPACQEIVESDARPRGSAHVKVPF